MTKAKKMEQISAALGACAGSADFPAAVRGLLAVMGYRSERTLSKQFSGDSGEAFLKKRHKRKDLTAAQQGFCAHVQSVHGLFQYAGEELEQEVGRDILLEDDDDYATKSFFFYAVELKDSERGDYPRGKYAEWTRVINHSFAVPTVVLFRSRDAEGKVKITFSFVGRRAHKLDKARKVLQAVSLLREINVAVPHRGHLEILYALTLAERRRWMRANRKPVNFDSLLAAWLQELDVEALNNRFYDDLAEWFEWAVEVAKFPAPAKAKTATKSQNGKQSEQVIRLINRILFIWFLKEKGLVAEELFQPESINGCLKQKVGAGGDSYYRAVLQNLFFATLNTDIKKRRFRKHESAGQDKDHRVFAFYRYEDLISDKSRLLKFFKQTPFVNGGLFDCLDDPTGKKNNKGGKRVDCFTDVQRKQLSIPDKLFFNGDESRKGLFEILREYKFVVEENTPIEQDVALDPELLGKVYERLLAYVNRGDFGAYYTPRTVVDYMVRETITHCFCGTLPPPPHKNYEAKVRLLLTAKVDYDALPDKDKLSDAEKEGFVDAVSNLRLLDPAVGSGAFLMGALTQLTMALDRIDPENEILHKRETARAKNLGDKTIREKTLALVEKQFSPQNRYNNYNRKLAIIRDCLFGVDVTSPAVQICRLRFFVSLAIEQTTNDDISDNYGIDPLPNLDGRIIVADTLIKIKRLRSLWDGDPKIKEFKSELKKIKDDFFHATTYGEKKSCIRRDEEMRKLLGQYLVDEGICLAEDAERIATWDWRDHANGAEWFDPEWMFDLSGFDAVIGNPPYIQLQIKGERGRLADLYPEGDYDVHDRRGDVYALFYERGVELLRDGGHLMFITSRTYMRADYGESLRKYLRLRTFIKSIIDFGELPVFQARVGAAVLLTQKKAAPSGASICVAVIEKQEDIGNISETIEEYGFPIPLEKLSDEGWILAPEEVLNLINKIKRGGIRLETYLDKMGGSIFYGIKTGLDRAFIIDEETRQQLTKDAANSEDLIRPFLQGTEIQRWRIQREDGHLIFTTPKTPIHAYRAVRAHLAKWRTRLERRAVPGREHWYALSSPIASHKLFCQPKIVYGETSAELHSCLDETGLYVSATAYTIISKGREGYLLGILNSELMDFFYRHTFPAWGDPWLDGRIRFRGSRMKALPIMEADAQTRDKIAKVVKHILAAPQGHRRSDLEVEMNDLVYKLYGITASEKVLVQEWRAHRQRRLAERRSRRG